MHSSQSPDIFTIELRGDVVVIVVSSSVERFDSTLIESAAELMMMPLRSREDPLVIVDLLKVDYFGSAFLQLLLRCWNYVTKVKGGQMVLASASPRARDLLHITSLDIIWPIYANRQEATDALLVD